jgi:hypothetical protein
VEGIRPSLQTHRHSNGNEKVEETETAQKACTAMSSQKIAGINLGEIVRADPSFDPSIIPIKQQISQNVFGPKPASVGSFFDLKGSSWLHENKLVQQNLPCQRLVFTVKCVLPVFLAFGCIFLTVSC